MCAHILFKSHKRIQRHISFAVVRCYKYKCVLDQLNSVTYLTLMNLFILQISVSNIDKTINTVALCGLSYLFTNFISLF